MVIAIGLSNLQFVDLNSSRNQFVLAISLFMGITVAEWTQMHQDNIKTGRYYRLYYTVFILKCVNKIHEH